MLIGNILQYFFGIAIFISSIFLILLVLVQRGRGGGLTGALGGPGGQSAFGTKAGDLFTRITIGVAAFWILLCASSVIVLKSRSMPELGPSTANSQGASGSVGGVGGDSSGEDIGSPTTGGNITPASDEDSSGNAESSDTDAVDADAGNTDGAPAGDDSASSETANADAAETNADEETPTSTGNQ